MAIKISACYITKNEEHTLARSLTSLKGQVDELIVVDTGSTDNTVAVAKEYGAQVYHYEWTHDFAAARNAALKKATGDWIIFLDADEILHNNIEIKLSEIIESDSDGGGYIFSLCNIDEESGKEFDKTWVLRMFPNKDNLRYVGSIHEELRDNGKCIADLKMITSDAVSIIHTGYSLKYNKEKNTRNLKLLLSALKTDYEPKRLYRYLADTYSQLGDEVEAVRYAELDIAMGRRSIVYASQSYHIILAILARYPQMLTQRLHFARGAVTDYPELPEFWAELAQCYNLAGDKYKAVELLKKALNVQQPIYSLEPRQFDDAIRQLVVSQIKKLEQY